MSGPDRPRRSDRIRDRDRPVGREARGPRPEHPPTPDGPTGPPPGRGLVRASWLGTGVLAATVAAGLVALDDVGPLVVGVSIALFCAGSVAFFVAYARAVGRSRHELIGIGGLYFMADSAPRAVRRSMMASFALQVLLVLVAVVARPFSSLVFTSLAPLYGLGLAGWWVSRHGTFPPKEGPRRSTV